MAILNTWFADGARLMEEGDDNTGTMLANCQLKWGFNSVIVIINPSYISYGYLAIVSAT